MKKKLVIFGIGSIGQLVKLYFENDSQYEVAAFTLDDNFIKDPIFEGLKVHEFSNIEVKFPPLDYDMFIAIGYSDMNQNREKKFFEAKEKGYKLATFVSSRCTYLAQEQPGENTFIFENNAIQPFVKIGKNVIIWSSNIISHHSTIEDHIFISSHVSVGGHCLIKSNSFLGLNSTIGPNVIVAEKTLVGAGAVIVKNTITDKIYVAPKAIKLTINSAEIKL